MKSMLDKIDFQEINIERIEKIRSVNKTEDGVFDISFNHIAYLKDGRVMETESSLSNYLGKDVLVIDVNNGQEVLWIDSDTHNMTKFEKNFYIDSVFFLLMMILPFSWIRIILDPANHDIFITAGLFLICLLFSFFYGLRFHNDILIKAKAIFKIRSFKKKYRSIKEP